MMTPAAIQTPPASVRPIIRFAERIRWWPFMLASSVSVGLSALAPEGRRPFHFDVDLSAAALEFSLGKDPHIGAAALLAMLAVTATGRARWLLAWALTVGVGAGWELGQTTVIGHTARLADLAPDAIGAAWGCVWGVGLLYLLKAGADDLG